jgi:hypothetical protein
MWPGKECHSKSKEQWLVEMGGFRFGESVELKLKRQRKVAWLRPEVRR